MGRVAGQRRLYLLVHDNVDLDTLLSLPLEQVIKPVLLVVVGRSSEEELRRQPPVGDVDGLLGLLQSDRDGPEVVASIDVPLDEVPLTLREEGLIAVRLADLGSLVVTDYCGSR